jgi:DNA-binding CsgD family transcriptional regulator
MSKCPLTAAELEVVQLFGDGLGYKEIAARRGCSLSTVRSHLHSACGKLGVRRSAQAVLRCAREGWVVSEPAQSASRHVGRLAAVTEALVGAVERRDGISVAQRDYLAAFEEMLYARSEDDKIVARFHMDQALAPVLGPTPVRPSGRVKRDLVELLASAIAGSGATAHRGASGRLTSMAPEVPAAEASKTRSAADRAERAA